MGIAADLDSIIDSGEKSCGMIVGVEFGKVFGDEKGVVEGTFADMTANGRKGDNVGSFGWSGYYVG